MRKITTVTSVLVASLLLSACGKEGQFKSAINKNIADEYQCLSLGVEPMLGASNFPYQKYTKYKDENTAVILKLKKEGRFVEDAPLYDKNKEEKLNALQKAGLLKKTEPAIEAYSKSPIEGEVFIVELYNLTGAGQKTVKEGGRFYGKKMLCYTHPQVDKILNYRQANVGGVAVAEVKYSYRYVDIAKWAKNKNIQAQFPEILKSLSNTDKTNVIDLEKTRNGWQTGL